MTAYLVYQYIRHTGKIHHDRMYRTYCIIPSFISIVYKTAGSPATIQPYQTGSSPHMPERWREAVELQNRCICFPDPLDLKNTAETSGPHPSSRLRRCTGWRGALSETREYHWVPRHISNCRCFGSGNTIQSHPRWQCPVLSTISAAPGMATPGNRRETGRPFP